MEISKFNIFYLLKSYSEGLMFLKQDDISVKLSKSLYHKS